MVGCTFDTATGSVRCWRRTRSPALWVLLLVLYGIGEVFAVPLMVRGYAQIAEPANISPSLEMVGALGFKATLFV